jgi:hypothetical protein
VRQRGEELVLRTVRAFRLAARCALAGQQVVALRFHAHVPTHFTPEQEHRAEHARRSPDRDQRIEVRRRLDFHRNDYAPREHRQHGAEQEQPRTRRSVTAIEQYQAVCDGQCLQDCGKNQESLCQGRYTLLIQREEVKGMKTLISDLAVWGC